MKNRKNKIRNHTFMRVKRKDRFDNLCEKMSCFQPSEYFDKIGHNMYINRQTRLVLNFDWLHFPENLEFGIRETMDWAFQKS